ncbi:MAG: shikimate dehydrogenase [Anaerolineae bacterium]
MNRVGLIGWPVSHSISPALHNAAFAALGMQDWQYDLQPVPPDVLKGSLKTLKEEGGYVGVNVTVPHKETVMPFVKPDALAQAIGAVNTIDFRDDTATNTDVYGFMDDLQANGIDPNGMNVVLIGAGGAARAALYGLASTTAKIKVVNRTLDKAVAMIHGLGVSASAAKWEAVKPDEVQLIVNCTVVGMVPKQDECAWNEAIAFPKGAIVYDMVYRPAKTRLMDMAEANGGRAVGGLGMLVRQGAFAFKKWTGVMPPLDVMFAAAREALGQKR